MPNVEIDPTQQYDIDHQEFVRFTVGTPAIDTDGKNVMVLSDQYVPKSLKAISEAKEHFSPSGEPLANYRSDGGFHHIWYKTTSQGVYYHVSELEKQQGVITTRNEGYSRPWDEATFLKDMEGRK